MWICAKTELQPSTDEAQKAAARALEDHGGGLQGPDGTITGQVSLPIGIEGVITDLSLPDPDLSLTQGL